MRISTIYLFAKYFWNSTFRAKAIYAMLIIFAVLIGFAASSGAKSYHAQNEIRTEHQHRARESWEANPDKHPHRMSHFGSFAFRMKHPLCMFDFGIESFTGNAVFLEAHKQNTVNFSEASFSTGTLRFGELSLAMILQIVLPLIIFFLGFSAVVSEKEDGTLKILLTQGAKWKEILLGKSLGLFGLAFLFFFPVLIASTALLISDYQEVTVDVWLRYGVLFFAYILFLVILSIVTISVSASSRTAKNSLIKLLALWLLFVVLVPRTTQALGNYFYPSPSKAEFQSEIEREIVQVGDSHNPNDPHFIALKDSLLATYHVDTVTELPFNYAGFVMSMGEKTSSRIYNKHNGRLLQTYQKQNNLSRFLAVVNPYIAIKNISMALTETDFMSYVHFQEQAEAYRYHLTQKMNEFHMKYINSKHIEGTEGKIFVVGKEHWLELPDFKHQFFTVYSSLAHVTLSLLSILAWAVASIWFIFHLSKKAKAL